MTQHEVADHLGINRSQVAHAVRRSQGKPNKKDDAGFSEFFETAFSDKTKQGFEERKPRVFKDDDIWTISSGGRNPRTVKISEEALRQLKKYYCLEGLTINQLCREMQLPRRDFYLIKTAFGITKDDAPYIDEDLIAESEDDLVVDSLQEKKRLYFVKLDQEEVKHLRRENEKYRRKEYFMERVKEIVASDLPEFAKTYTGPTIIPKKVDNGFIVEPNIFDLHLGKLSWRPETGADYDYKIARDRFDTVTSDVYNRAKQIAVERFIYPFGSDFWHIDNKRGTTNAGTAMDYDSRVQKLFMVGVKMLIRSIDAYAEIAPVDVVLVAGNHDEEISYFALQVLAAWYKDSKVVNVWDNLRQRKYIWFGYNLIGYDHGANGFKRLPGNMSTEAPEAWGKTRLREWHTGHLHKLSVDEESGVTVRRLPSVTASDAWHDREGFVGALCRSQAFCWSRYDGLNAIWETTIWSDGDADQSVLAL
jgi:hypothetical protein